MFIFDRCCRSSAAMTAVKYECDANNLTGTFVRSNILLTEKLTNEALVTPTPGLSRNFLWNELANKRMHTVFSMIFVNGFNADIFSGSKVITSQHSRALVFAVVGLRAIALCQCKDRTSASVSTVVFHRRIVYSFVIGRYISKANHNKMGSGGIITHLYMWLYMLSVLQPKQAK